MKLKNIYLILTLLTATQLMQANKALKEIIGNILLSPITSSESSQEITSQAEAISRKLNPKSEVTVKNLNALGRLLVGYKNTISVPFINQLLINEEWLKSLPTKSKEFVLARGINHLLSYPYEYSIYKYLFPFVLYNFCKYADEGIETYTNISFPSKQLIYFLSQAILLLLPSYYLRNIEYELDAQTAIKFNCFDGAISALLDSIKFNHKGSKIDQLNSKVSAIELINLGAKCAYYCYTLKRLIHNNNFLSSIQLHKLNFILLTFLSFDFIIPGRFNDRPSALFNFIKNLPLVNLIFNHPKPYKRIRELTDLRNRIIRERILKK